MSSSESGATTECPLCDESAETSSEDNPLAERWFDCDRCGKFNVDRARVFPKDEIANRHLLSGLAREYWERRQERLLIPCDIERIQELSDRAPGDRDVPEKTKRLLLALARMTEYPGQLVECARKTDYPLAFCRNDNELSFFFRHLDNRNFIQDYTESSGAWTAVISSDGWAAIEAHKMPSAESEKVFVAMWFNDAMDPAYEDGIRPAIKDDCGYDPVKINLQEFLNDMVDEIIAEIRESRFIVADFTGQRHGVYYEAGYARGLGLPVIWTCRKDDVDKLHFDTRQQNHIVWETPEELRERLANRIRAVIGLGPHKRT